MSAELAPFVENAYAIERTTSCRVRKLIDQLESIEERVSQFCQIASVSKSRSEQISLENEEAVSRFSLISMEASARGEITLVCLTQERLQSRKVVLSLSAAQKSVGKEPSSEVKHDESKYSSSSSLNDLTDLLDECWRVLEE